MSLPARWESGEQIANMLDSLRLFVREAWHTSACSRCGGPARVPEDVVGVVRVGDQQSAYVVCENCYQAYAAEIGMVTPDGS